MPTSIAHKLIIGISSRALFDLDESNQVFEQEGVDKYADYQIAHENDVLQPGPAFPLTQKLLKLNQEQDLVEVVLLSRNSADTGLRIFNSIQHYNLNITRAAFTNGKSPYEYLNAFQAHLFLSMHSADVTEALAAGHAAAIILPPPKNISANAKDEVRIAFDGDAVVFSDESERIFQRDGLEAFSQHEDMNANQPLNGGPFKGFLAALHNLQKHYSADQCPIRTALITARQAPAHKRVIQTLRAWNVRIDEAIFLGGIEKGSFLRAFHADIFFDDQHKNCQSAALHVAAGHVPNNIVGL